ncbi:MAG: hypothetical protein FWE35_03325 [Streptosporangiales bacterium]|nr:hypothetical protein [Streptosporangiales bacterium]
MFSSQGLWALYFAGLAILFFLPTLTALVKRTKGLPTVIGLNVLGVILPVPCWIAAMGFAVCGVSRRSSRRPPAPEEPARMLLGPPAARAPGQQREMA